LINFITNPDIFPNFKKLINENNNSKKATYIRHDIKDEQKLESANPFRCKIKKRNQNDCEDFKEENKKIEDFNSKIKLQKEKIITKNNEDPSIKEKDLKNVNKNGNNSKEISEDEDGKEGNVKINHYVYEDEEKNKKLYAFQKKYGNIIDSRCKDYKCAGRAQYLIQDGKLIITQYCTKEFEEHDYCIENIITERIKEKKNNIRRNGKFYLSKTILSIYA